MLALRSCELQFTSAAVGAAKEGDYEVCGASRGMGPLVLLLGDQQSLLLSTKPEAKAKSTRKHNPPAKSKEIWNSRKCTVSVAIAILSRVSSFVPEDIRSTLQIFRLSTEPNLWESPLIGDRLVMPHLYWPGSLEEKNMEREEDSLHLLISTKTVSASAELELPGEGYGSGHGMEGS